jgi:purine-binding chemotaxis protein CheW
MPDEVKRTGDEVQLVLFELEDETYAIEIHQVREIIKLINITPVPRTPTFIRGIINLRGKIVIVTDIKERFNLKKTRQGTHIVIIDVEGNTFGIIVDDVSRVLRIMRDDIKETPSIITEKIHAKYAKGVVIQEDKLVILLDPSALYSEDEFAELGETRKEVKDKVVPKVTDKPVVVAEKKAIDEPAGSAETPKGPEQSAAAEDESKSDKKRAKKKQA